MACYGRIALASLCRYLGRKPEDWMTVGICHPPLPAAPGAAVEEIPDLSLQQETVTFLSGILLGGGAKEQPAAPPVQSGERDLPPLPEPHRTKNLLRCMACKKPYTPVTTAAANASPVNWACTCGCGTFEGIIGYEPQPQYTPDQMREYARAAITSVTKETKK
jgi:hypothetical protein